MQRSPSPSEPVTEVKKVPINECGEPLVDFLEHCPRLILAKPVFEYVRATLVRASIAEMLNSAIEALPKGYSLGIMEGWRPKYIQRRMWKTGWIRYRRLHPDWSDHRLLRAVNTVVAPPGAVVPPPHSTGGAIDISLVDAEGKRIDHSSPYAMFDTASYAMDTPGLTDEASRHRVILKDVLLSAGLTNYPSEWWHWSYGDQGWAYRAGDGRAAIFGRIDEPENWTPVAEDDNDEPLVRLGTDPASGFPRLKAS